MHFTTLVQTAPFPGGRKPVSSAASEVHGVAAAGSNLM